MPACAFPVYARQVLDRLLGAGFKAVYVGGCVRDLLLGNPSVDIDIGTNATPDQVRRLFPDTVDLGGAKHGTLLVRLDGYTVEVTTFRTESGYTDFRHPDQVVFTDSLVDDLARRDFTINALAMLPDGTIVDRFGGLEDLRRKLIRTVGQPAERFAEDPLRMVRAVRFACQLGFALEETARRAVREAVFLLENISIERIRDEFVRIMASPSPSAGLELSRELDILRVAVPELLAYLAGGRRTHRWNHALRTTDAAANLAPGDLALAFAALLHGLGPAEAERCLRRLKLYRERLDRTVPILIRHRGRLSVRRLPRLSDRRIRRLLASPGRPVLEKTLTLSLAHALASEGGEEGRRRAREEVEHFRQRVQDILAGNPPLSRADLAITGTDVAEMLGDRPGPRVGDILDILLEAVLDDPSRNNPETLRHLAARLARHRRDGGLRA